MFHPLGFPQGVVEKLWKTLKGLTAWVEVVEWEDEETNGMGVCLL